MSFPGSCFIPLGPSQQDRIRIIRSEPVSRMKITYSISSRGKSISCDKTNLPFSARSDPVRTGMKFDENTYYWSRKNLITRPLTTRGQMKHKISQALVLNKHFGGSIEALPSEPHVPSNFEWLYVPEFYSAAYKTLKMPVVRAISNISKFYRTFLS